MIFSNYREILNDYVRQNYINQDFADDVVTKIANFDGTEESFRVLEAYLSEFRYAIGSLKAARLFLEIARGTSNEKYSEVFRKRDLEIVAALESAWHEGVLDRKAARDYIQEHRLEHLDLNYYLYLAAANTGDKNYVKKYIEDQCDYVFSFASGYNEIETFLSEHQCNWDGDLEEYFWSANQDDVYFVYTIESLSSSLIEDFFGGEGEFDRIERFAAFNKYAYKAKEDRHGRLTLEEYLLKLAKEQNKPLYAKLQKERKEKYLRQIDRMLSDGGAEISYIRNQVVEMNRSTSADMEDLAFRAAVRSGNADYIKAAAPDLKLYIKQRYSKYLEETDDTAIRDLIREYGAWVKDHTDECELVLRMDRRAEGIFIYSDDEVIHYEQSFLKEAYGECKYKRFDTYEFTDMMDLERASNGRVKYKNWQPSDLNNVVAALNRANEALYFEGHYTWGSFFEWQWEPDVDTVVGEVDDCKYMGRGEERGYLYVLKNPYRHGHKEY